MLLIDIGSFNNVGGLIFYIDTFNLSSLEFLYFPIYIWKSTVRKIVSLY